MLRCAANKRIIFATGMGEYICMCVSLCVVNLIRLIYGLFMHCAPAFPKKIYIYIKIRDYAGALYAMQSTCLFKPQTTFLIQQTTVMMSQ